MDQHEPHVRLQRHRALERPRRRRRSLLRMHADGRGPSDVLLPREGRFEAQFCHQVE